MENSNEGIKFVDLRKRAGVTQKELATTLGVTDHTVRNWEKGREQPRLFIWQVKALCQKLQCSLDDLPDDFATEQSAEAGNNNLNAEHND
ncbi:MAG: helix-turn-helix transcriptional regulator [Cyanobacteria bacterium RM1_2_2]|nr:helix-turn-helix transcriptional regulator [Cyanobacteria bacterium RM1_2_2]